MEEVAGTAGEENVDGERFMKPHQNNSGFSFVDLLMIIFVVSVIIALLPIFYPRHHTAMRISCTNNLKQAGLAFRIWAGDNNDKFPMQIFVTNGGAMEMVNEGSAYAVFLVMSNELNTPKLLVCPDENNRRRVPAVVFSPVYSQNRSVSVIVFSPTNNISYFVGLDANDTKPHEILAGDDHFQVAGKTSKPGLFLLSTNAPVEWRNERHPKQGNIAMADGSVQSFSTPAFRDALVKTGIATNRLAMP